MEPNQLIKQEKIENKQKLPKYTYPPDFQKAQKHRLAMRIFKGVQNDETGIQCQCCQRRVGIEDAQQPCCYDKLQLAFLGPGVPLFFKFVQNAILLLIALCLVFCIFALYSNVTSQECTDQKCTSPFDTISIINKASNQDYLSIQNYTLVAFVVLSFIILQGFRYTFRKVQDDCDDSIDSPSDYAMILRRLPPEVQVSDIQNMIEERRGYLTPQQVRTTQNLRVINIVMSFAMGQYVEAQQKNIQQFHEYIDQDKADQFIPKPLPKLDQYATVAIVIFARQQSKQLFKYKPNFFQKLLQCIWSPCLPRSDYVIRDQKIAIQRAPEPDDINWQNCKISEMGAICRKTIYSLICIIVLLAGGAAQYGIAVLKTQIDGDDTTKMVLSTASSICVSIINFLIQIVLIFTSERQRNETKTEFNSVVMVKISFFQFLNAGIFVVLSNFLADIENFNLFDGVVFQAVLVMTLNAVVHNALLLFLTYFQIISKIKRCLVQRNILKKSQIQANQIWQGPQVQIQYKYSYIFKTIWLTAFYAPLAPIVVPISIFGLILNFVLQKLLFGHKYSIPNTISSMLNDSAIQLLEYFPLILTIGELIVYFFLKNFVYQQIPQNWSIPLFVALGLCILNLLLPMEQLNKKLFSLPTDNMVYPDYQKVQEKFQVTYAMTNPGYQCNKKRNRDKFIMNKLFGGNALPMQNMFGGSGMPNNNNTQMNMLNNTNSPYQNNNIKNDPSSNPFGAMLAGGTMNTTNQNNNNNHHQGNNFNNANHGHYQPNNINQILPPPPPPSAYNQLDLNNSGLRNSVTHSNYYKPVHGVYQSQKKSQRSEEQKQMRKKFKLPEAALFSKIKANMEF